MKRPNLLVRHLSVLVLITLCGAVGIAQAGVYRWVDENGKVHFGDRPPVDAGAEALEMPESPVSSETPDVTVEERRERQRRLVEALEEERREKEQKKQEAADKQKKRDAYCRRLLAEVKDSERINRYYEYDEDGNRIFMSDEEADRYRANLRATYQARCQSE